VAGFVTSVTAAVLMLISFGFLAFISVIAAPFAIFYSRRGKRAVDEGNTRKHRGLAQAGFVIGIVTFVISAIVTVLLIIFIVALATDEEFRREFENDGGFDSTTVRVTLLAARVVASVA
jgi:ABC-type Fe3+ transport system permease subunit